MRTTAGPDGGAILEVDRRELVLLYGALVEAMEALSATEFRARIGIRESEAELLQQALKPLVQPDP